MKLRSFLLPTALLIWTGCASTSLDFVELRYEQKMARLLKLEDERSLGEGEIISRLADREPRVRRRAALALGRIGQVEAAEPLTRLLADPEPAVRAMAAFALGEMEGDLPAQPLAALRTALVDSDPEVRGRAAESLGKAAAAASAEEIAASLFRSFPGSPGPLEMGEAIEDSALKQPHMDLRLGLFALARLKRAGPARSVLATELDKPRFLWWPAAWSAMRLEAAELLPILLHYGGSNDPYLRALGARGLARIPHDSSRRAILQLLEDPVETVRIEAVRAAGSLGLRGAVPRLLQSMKADTAYVQVESVRALGSIRHPSVADSLVDRLSDRSPWIRAAALRALAFQDPDGFWLLLSGMDPDPDWSVRAALAELLGDLGGARAGSILHRLASDSDFRVRPHVLRAIVKGNLPELAGLLIDHLAAEDPFERAAAAEGLGKRKPDGGLSPLLSAFEAAAGDSEPDARLAILQALEAYGREAVEPAARQAMRDRSWNVRRRGAEILRRMGEATARADGPTPGRSLYDYLDLLSPQYTPRAFIRTEKGPIELELFVLDAPLTVENFIHLARKGFYNGLTFHRVVPNFVVQAGDPRGDSNGGPGYAIRCEVNTRPYLRGTVGMALSGKDTGGSQFFITQLPQPHLDGGYTVFGQVVAGMAVVDRLEPGDLIREIVIWDGTSSGLDRGTTPDTTDSRPGGSGRLPRSPSYLR